MNKIHFIFFKKKSSTTIYLLNNRIRSESIKFPMLQQLPEVLRLEIASFAGSEDSLYVLSKEWHRLLSSNALIRYFKFTPTEIKDIEEKVDLLARIRDKQTNVGRIAALCHQSKSLDFYFHHPTINLLTPNQQADQCCLVKPFLVTPYCFRKTIEPRIQPLEFHTYSPSQTKEWMEMHTIFTPETPFVIAEILRGMPYMPLFIRTIVSFFIITNTSLNFTWNDALKEKVNEYSFGYHTDLHLIQTLESWANRIIGFHRFIHSNSFEYLLATFVLLGTMAMLAFG